VEGLWANKYFGEKEAFSVIIASHLTEQQEEDLLVVLKEKSRGH